MKRVGVLFVATLLVALPCFADDWRLYKSKDKDDIKIYYRAAPVTDDLIEFKAITHIKCDLEAIVAVVRDVSSMSEWVYKVRSAKLIKRDETGRYIHIIHDSPLLWLKDRDTVVLSKIEQDPITKTVKVIGRSVPDYLEDSKDYIRVRQGQSSWTFEPQEDGLIKVTFQGYADPGGFLKKAADTFLAKNYLWRLPYVSMKNLKSQVKKAKYQGKEVVVFD